MDAEVQTSDMEDPEGDKSKLDIDTTVWLEGRRPLIILVVTFIYICT